MDKPPASPSQDANKTEAAAPATNQKPKGDEAEFDGVTWELIFQAGTKNSGKKQQQFAHIATHMRHKENRKHNELLTALKNFGKFAKSYKRKISIFELYEPFSEANRVTYQSTPANAAGLTLFVF